MYRLGLFFATVLFFIHPAAQGQAMVSGHILDGSTNQPLLFASVALNRSADGALVSGAITDDKGFFALKGIGKGDYDVVVSYVGYDEKTLDFRVGELNYVFDLGKIALVPSSKTLGDVVVAGSKSATSSDLAKKTFSIDDNIAQAGGSVLETMKMMPGVTVSQEGKIILRGSDKVVVLMDGKQSSLTGFGNQKGLDNIPVANIEKIEIINNPSAKYDASGMAGIINIVYKKAKQEGFNGDVGMAYCIGAMTKRKTDLPTALGSYSPTPKYIPSLTLNYRTSKLNFFLLSELYLQQKLPNNEFTTRYYDDGRKTISQVPENRTQTHIILNGGMDWTLDESNNLTFSALYDWEIHVDTTQVPYIDLNTNQRYRYYSWNEEEITGFMNYAATYKHKFEEPGHEFSIQGQYTKGWEDESYALNDSSLYRPAGKDATHILATEHTTFVSADYVKPLPRGRLEAGMKTQIRRLPVEYTTKPGEQTIIYPGLGEWSDWGEDTYAAYANVVHERMRFDVEMGLRAEYTAVFYDLDPANAYYLKNDSYNNFELFPNVRLTFKINAKNSISAFYNRRVDRPGEPQLRVFPKYDDPELLKVGNPYLRPQFTQSFELAYKIRWETGSLFSSGFYRLIDNPFMRVYSIDSSNPQYDVVNKIYQNTGSATNQGVEVLLSQEIAGFWKLSGGFNYYQNRIDAYTGWLLFPYERPFQIHKSVDNTWDMKISNQFTLPAELRMQLTGLYYAPKNIPQGKESARSSIDLGITKKVMKKRGEVYVSVSDIFNNFGLRQEITEDGVKAVYENYYETQVIRVGMKYKF